MEKAKLLLGAVAVFALLLIGIAQILDRHEVVSTGEVQGFRLDKWTGETCAVDFGRALYLGHDPEIVCLDKDAVVSKRRTRNEPTRVLVKPPPQPRPDVEP